jgi:Uma2 family endonuclease
MVAERTFITQEAYLIKERDAFEKSEYFEGEIYPMAGATKEHNRIKENLSIKIGGHLWGKPCQSFSSDFRVHLPANSLYAYPDLVVVCGEMTFLDDEFDTLLNPDLLIEILSRGTRGYDKTAKFGLYRTIPSFREYITVDSERINVEVWQKSDEDIWMLAKETTQIQDTIYIRTIDLPLSLQDIYPAVKSW